MQALIPTWIHTQSSDPCGTVAESSYATGIPASDSISVLLSNLYLQATLDVIKQHCDGLQRRRGHFLIQVLLETIVCSNSEPIWG
jgi:hypothetical protein